METPRLITHIQEQIAAGLSRDAIRQVLLSKGWTEHDIAEAFTSAAPLHAPSKPRTSLEKLPSEKFHLAIVLAIVSAVYTTWQFLGGGQQPAVSIAATDPSSSTTVVARNTPARSVPTPATPVPVQQSAKAASQYADGTYTGEPVDAFYGIVQVEAIIEDGKLANIKFLQSPKDRNTSLIINGEAMPVLIQQAIAVQSAQVDTASGATFTSEAFRQSLASALAVAKN